MKTITAPYTTTDSPHQLVQIGSVSSMERERLAIRSAIPIEGYRDPISRAMTRALYAAAAIVFALTLAMLVFTDGPSETDALHASALDLKDAQAAALLTAGGRK
jgi:hypothetical protein